MTEETTGPTEKDLPRGGQYTAEEHLAAQTDQVNTETGARISPEQAEARNAKAAEPAPAEDPEHTAK